MILHGWSFRLHYGLRLAASGMTALYVAMWLQLDVPRWALLTAMMVSPPVRGDVLRKTVARVMGTPVGCAAAVALAGIFPQDRLGYLLGLSLWIGLCGFFATYRHGYVAYFAILAGFTAVIVGAGTASHPEFVFDTALNRGAATLVGVFCAGAASAFVTSSDDAPGELVDKISGVWGGLLEWAIARSEAAAQADIHAFDVPMAKPILDLDAAILNAMAERPVLRRFRPWLAGVPTALMSMHVSLLELTRDDSHANGLKDLDLIALRELLRDKSNLNMTRLDTISGKLKLRRETFAPLVLSVVESELFVLVALKATLSFERPPPQDFLFPRPSFNVTRTRAWFNLFRPLINVSAVFAIWDATAWSSGPTLLTYVGVFSIVALPFEDPVTPLKGVFLGALLGIAVGLISLYLLFPLADSFVWLTIVMGSMAALFGIGQTFPKLAGISLGFANLVLVVTNPTNPQRYDLSASLNSAIATLFGVAIAATSFELFGAAQRGPARVEQGLNLMRRQLSRAYEIGNRADRAKRLRWETRLCDELTRIQAASHDPADRHAAVELVLQNRFALQQPPAHAAWPALFNSRKDNWNVPATAP